MHITQLLAEIASGRFTLNEEFIELIREAALVNLYFYLKVIAAFDGPYDKITKHLHLPMCNWRQSPACMKPGARGAGFMPRSHFKSTVWTHGAAGWEILRDPNIRIRLTSSRIDKAEGFRNTILSTFKYNPFFAELFPDYIIKPSQAELTVPNRTKKYPEPTIKIGSTGGAAAGDHHDLLLNDDLIDEQDINAEHMSTIEMTRKIGWFNTAMTSLVIDWKDSRILVFGTRYALDDLYDKIWNNGYEIQGLNTPDFKVNPDGEYSIYYRKAVEDGKSIFPEAFPLSRYDKMANSEDPNTRWTYQTQYMNDPKDSGLTEWNTLNPKECLLVWNDPLDSRPYVIKSIKAPVAERVYLSELNLLAAVDPAFTSKGITAKTSKSGFVILGIDHESHCYVLYTKSGYYDPYDFMTMVFEGIELFRGYVSRLVVERNGQQILLEKPYNEMKRNRGTSLMIDFIPSSGDKIARIRTTLGAKLLADKVSVGNTCLHEFIDAMHSFPMSMAKLDLLDAASKAVQEIRKPDSPAFYKELEEIEEEKQFELIENCTGY